VNSHYEDKKLTRMKWLWGPVLLVQGFWVRMKTPKLPEPAMRRSGVVGKGQALRLLLLGDSSAAGVGAEKPEEGLLGQLLEQLRSEYTVHFEMLAKTGYTTVDAIEQLRTSEARPVDVVVTALGVNDVTSQLNSQQWLAQQTELLGLIIERYNPTQIIVSGLPPVADFPALPWPLNQYLGRRADLFDQTLPAELADIKPAEFLSLRGWPKSALPASDGFHPGPSVYRLWAQKISERISHKRKNGPTGD